MTMIGVEKVSGATRFTEVAVRPLQGKPAAPT
jgi:hypothetical protein